ncbi:hypothetical protein TNCV_1202951 [Trichonephila clavipes]|nr:hypothetical protein TNCV_1202951 [Trichonephila clavipes]
MRKKKVPESLEELPSGLFPSERHFQITSENFIDFTFQHIKYGPDKEPTFKEMTISREQWAEMIEKYGAIENAAIDNMFQCMDFLTAYKTFCKGPIENELPSSLDVSLGQEYLMQILEKSICSLMNQKGLKQPQTFAEELWGNREETFNSYVSSLEANEIADCFYNNLFENEHFLLLKPVHYVTQEFFKNLRLDIILRELFSSVTMYQDLAAFYETPEVPNSFGGVEALHRSVKGKYSKKSVKHWLSQKEADTLHKPVRHKF